MLLNKKGEHAACKARGFMPRPASADYSITLIGAACSVPILRGGSYGC